ncbi:MAG TPA: hypothetical protein VHW09_16450 [Bryobacteraceae bacterium]|jgi:hypothetical protein|nr:hypothetical protein [Bryobacteraceae bacterium]
MKSICAAAGMVLFCSAILLAQTAPPKSSLPSASIKCKNEDGHGCTQKQVQALSDAVYAGKSQHDVLVPVKDLELAASDGTLRCAQSNGTVCTTAELDIIKEIAASQHLTIKYK